jgi:hypothetical protein
MITLIARCLENGRHDSERAEAVGQAARAELVKFNRETGRAEGHETVEVEAGRAASNNATYPTSSKMPCGWYVGGRNLGEGPFITARTNYEFPLMRDSRVYRYRTVALATLSLYLRE